MADKVYCPYHQTDHDLELIRRFAAKASNKSGCPIASVMELQSGVAVMEPKYTIVPKLATQVAWPQNIDLLITKLPATEKEGFTKGLVGYIANRTYQNMNANSLAYLVISSYKEQKERPFEIIQTFTAAGFKFVDTIVLEKNKFIPTQGSKRLNNVYDFMFMFSKGDNYHLNRESISYLKSDQVEDSEYKCAGNVWRIKVDDKDMLPVELINCVANVSNLLPNSLIVDPFMDSGATLKSALAIGHSYWGCESDPLKFKRCQKLVKDYRDALAQQYAASGGK